MASADGSEGPVLPERGDRDLYVVDGRVTYEPAAAGRDRSPRAGSSRDWSTRTATSGWTTTAPSTRRRPRSRRSPTATRARC